MRAASSAVAPSITWSVEAHEHGAATGSRAQPRGRERSPLRDGWLLIENGPRVLAGVCVDVDRRVVTATTRTSERSDTGLASSNMPGRTRGMTDRMRAGVRNAAFVVMIPSSPLVAVGSGRGGGGLAVRSTGETRADCARPCVSCTYFLLASLPTRLPTAVC